MNKNDTLLDALFNCVINASAEDREYVLQAARKLRVIKRRKRFTRRMIKMVGDAKHFVAVHPNQNAQYQPEQAPKPGRTRKHREAAE